MESLLKSQCVLKQIKSSELKHHSFEVYPLSQKDKWLNSEKFNE